VVRRLLTRLRRDQRGFTLIEQLVVAVGLVVVVSAIAGMTEVAERMAPRDNARGFAMRESQAGHDRMARELRHAYAVTVLPGPDAGNRLQAAVQLRGRQYLVEYDCSAAMPGAAGQRRCTRSEAGGADEPIIDRLVGAGPVFTRRLRDGFYLRNVDANAG
jgi:Flp pilus assembly pilin Flp